MAKAMGTEMDMETNWVESQKPVVEKEEPITTFATDEIQLWRKRMAGGVLRVIIFLGAFVVGTSLLYAFTSGNLWLIPFYFSAYTCLLIVTFWKRIPYTVQAWTLVGMIYMMALLDLVTTGRGSGSSVLLLAIPILVILFFGKREAILALALTLATLAVFGLANSTGLLPFLLEKQTHILTPIAWLNSALLLLTLGAMLLTALDYLVPRLTASLAQSRRLVKALDETHHLLREQTKEIENAQKMLKERTKALEAIGELARDASSSSDLHELLNRVVNLVSERFGFYHAGIFLLNPSREWAVLQAASSEGGRDMLERSHRLRVGQEGMVGYVTYYGKARIALDVGAEATFFNSPDLPETRSEITLPLRVRNEVIGALDVQSTAPEAFKEDDIAILQAIADQVATVISNVRLFQAVQESLEAERRAYSDLSQKAWGELLRERQAIGFRCDENGTSRLNGSQLGTKLEMGRTRTLPLIIPIQVRGQILGTVEASKSNGAEWSREDLDTAHALVSQLSTALDSARLYQETRRRAERERMAGEITAKLRASNDPQVILQTAVQELRQALGATRTQALLDTRAPVAERPGKKEQ
jgi:GAF domain-containing protein